MIPKKILNEILEDDFYKQCSRRHSGNCRGRITFEHAFIYAGRQIQESWAIIPLCEFHHAVDNHQDGGDLQKEFNWHIALQRASVADLAKYPRKDWEQLKVYLTNKYG